jgi:alkanesulfonate monooxygenase SsuD/methylene tetrahydromethanopterin reductase-like flavin-dependent oxidoreductase (luciferase family)
MRFGTFHLMERPFTKSEPQVYREHLEQIRVADAIGYDAVWLTEHHFSSVPYVPDVDGEYCISASPFAMACAVSQITENVRIGSAVKVLPLEHPLRTAEDVAMADILSGGRIDFGCGLGYRKYEFDGLDVSMDEKLERYKEALEIIRGVWTTEEFSYDGAFWKVPRLTLVPRTVQQPHPPVWIASRYTPRDVVDFALDKGYKLLAAWQPAHELRITYGMVQEARAEMGISGADTDFACIRHVFVGESDADARRQGSEAIEYYLKSTVQFRPVGDHEREQMIFGGPETCIEKVRELEQEAGINNLICWMNFGALPLETVLRSMRLFAEEVMPKFQTHRAAGKAAE